MFAPSNRALWAFGAAGAIPWQAGHWWTLLTAIYLHGGLLHILFNVLWIRQLGPEVEELYGPARLVVIFTVSGVAGFVASNAFGVPFTIGASGSIFGLLGAMVAFGQKRGGAFGAAVPAAVRSVGAGPVRRGLPHAGREQHRPRRRLRRGLRCRVWCCRWPSAGPRRRFDCCSAAGVASASTLLGFAPGVLDARSISLTTSRSARDTVSEPGRCPRA